MQKRIVTEEDLRSALLPADTKEYLVSQHTYVTPSAKDFLKERRIALVRAGAEGLKQAMPTEAIADKADRTYVDAYTGRGYAQKPEEMTHLRGNLLVLKTDPRIRFRGRIDSLQAKVLELQCLALEEKLVFLCEELEEVLLFLRALLAAEVKDLPFENISLLGMSETELRYASHHIEEKIGIPHPIPSYHMGKMAMALNSLRTQVREAELLAMELDTQYKADFIKAMNRLSSAVYILFCRLIKRNDKGRGND